jgi:hypothetical protein
MKDSPPTDEEILRFRELIRQCFPDLPHDFNPIQHTDAGLDALVASRSIVKWERVDGRLRITPHPPNNQIDPAGPTGDHKC